MGGDFALQINAAAICIGLCYANGLSPITDKYGWQYGFIAAIMHYLLVTSVPNLHGGFCLYNGGFTAALICLVLGYPVAYYIAHRGKVMQKILYMLVMLPMCMSFLLRTLAWVGLLQDTGIINNIPVSYTHLTLPTICSV